MTVNGISPDLELENPDSAFIGRKLELSKLGGALRNTRAGAGEVVLISGEPGVGKTVLVKEFSAFARTNGFEVLAGHCSARFTNLPFAVWKQIISDRPKQLGQSGSVLPRIESDSAPTAPAHPYVDSHSNPLLFEKIAGSLVDLARTQPLVLVLDDLHAADSLSLQAFRILARELSRTGTLIIGIYRDSEAKRSREFKEFLADPLIRGSKRIFLRAFDDDEIREFARSRSESGLEEQTLEALHALTGGNPRLLDIASRRQLFDGPTGSGKWLAGVLRAEIESHLEHLSEQAREVLSAASLAGAEFRFSTLAHVLEQPTAELLNSLQEAQQSGLLQSTEIPGTYRFRQSLVQEVLRAELGGAERARLHRQFGEVLENLHPQDDAFVERIAAHYYEAALLGCAEKAADYCGRAAALAQGAARRVDALRFYHMTLAALEIQGTRPDLIREVKAKLNELSFRQDQSSVSQFSSEVEASSSLDSHLARPRNFTASGAPAPIATDSVTQTESEINRNTFRREGEFWTLIFDERILRLKHSNGLVFVAYLLQHPDRDFHVSQLVALLPSGRANQAESLPMSHSEKKRLGMHTISGPDANPLLDPTAKAQYRSRIQDLRAALEEAKRLDDVARAEQLEKELEFIALELTRAVGAKGRDRKHRAEDERSRVNVTNAIRTLIAKIADEHPSFGLYLRLTVRTGRFCSYRPDSNSPAPSFQF